MKRVDYNLKATIIGSMPHTSAEKACKLITRHLKDMPAWPQLPKRSPLESMSIQYSRGFPGIQPNNSDLKVNSCSDDFDKALESLYKAYLEDDFARFAVTTEYAAGLHYFLNMSGTDPKAVKGQITGPISWCFSVKDQEGKAILHDDHLADAASRMLALSARWQEDRLKSISKNTLIFFDEPALSSYGSAFMSISGDKIKGLINEAMGKLLGLKGIHCCGNTDWSLVLSTNIDVLSLDTYNFGHTLKLYPDEAGRLIKRGGAIAWGIVPSNENEIASENIPSLKDRLEDAMAAFTSTGVSFKELACKSLLTPSCSLSNMSQDGAERALELLAGLSNFMQKRYL